MPPKKQVRQEPKKQELSEPAVDLSSIMSEQEKPKKAGPVRSVQMKQVPQEVIESHNSSQVLKIWEQRLGN